MQRICAVPGGVNAYLRDPDCLVSDETLVCPFCRDGHRLHRHDYYHRYALLLAPDESLRIPVRRLLCPVVGRTVSLLPDFCLPRRQHGPAILGVFLHAFAVLGLPLLLALRRARPDAPSHSVAQSLRRGFLDRAGRIRAYLAGIRPRVRPPPASTPPALRDLATLVTGLVHRAFSFDLAGDCWQADVMYGPSIPTKEGGRKRTYLIGILDDASRLIPHAQFYFEQHLRSLKDCLKQAFLKRGLPRRLYVDNGKIFRSRGILLLAARLGMQVLHTKPYKPQGRAKLERWFGSVRRSFLARIDADRLDSLEHLNRLLFAFVEGEYHISPHRGIERETPLDRFVRLSGGLRPLPPDVDLEVLFLEETTRRVAKDGTLTLNGHVFEAGPLFIGRRVTVRFDPFDLRKVLVEDDEKTVQAFPVDLAANRRVRRNPPPEPDPEVEKRPLLGLARLADRMDEDDHQEGQAAHVR